LNSQYAILNFRPLRLEHWLCSRTILNLHSRLLHPKQHHSARRQGRQCKRHTGLLPQQHRRSSRRHGTIPIRTRQPHRHAIHLRSTMPAHRFEQPSGSWCLFWIHGRVSYVDDHTYIYHYDQQHDTNVVVLFAGKALPEWNDHGY